MSTIQRNLTGFSLGIVRRFRNAPNLNIPTIHQEISVVALFKWQARLVFMGYSMLMQPVINSQFIGRSDKVPIIARKADTAVKSTKSDRNIKLFAQLSNRPGAYTVLCSNLVKRQAVFKIHLTKFLLSWQNDLYAFTARFPYSRTANLMPSQPVGNGGLIDTVHLANLIVTTMFYMDKVFQFFFSRFYHATVEQAAISSTAGDIVEPQPAKDFSLTHAVLTSNLARSKALSDIEAVHSFIIRTTMRCRGKGTLWQSLDAIPLEQMAYDRLINFKAFCNLLLSQSLSFIEVSKCFFIKLWSIVTLIRAIAGQGYCRGFAVKRFTATLANDRYKGRLTVSRSFGSSVGTIAIEQGKLNGVIQWGHSLLSLLLRFTGLGIDRVSSTVYAVSIFPHYTTSRANGLLFPVQIARVFQ